MEERFLLAIHEAAFPFLDALFLVSHWMGTVWFCTALVALAVVVSAARGNKREALLWLTLGISTYLLQKGIKELTMRPRPDLWVGPVHHTSFSFPSGHALASATFYPLLARALARRFPERAVLAWSVAAGVAFFVGFGRLYLGVHWPSDVLVGWTIGGTQTWAGMRLVDRRAAEPAVEVR